MNPSRRTLPREAAEDYIRRGIAPTPTKGKRPILKGWESRDVTLEDVPRLWNNGQNVGIRTGEPSCWLVDVDLDTPEAVALAPYFLPETIRSGRVSVPCCHYWYYCQGIGSVKYADVDGNTSLVEIRSNGRQTVVAPSVHPDGDAYVWHGEVTQAERVEPADLLKRVRCIATAAIVARHLPLPRSAGGGGRHGYALALAGFMLRAGRLEPGTALAILKAAWDVKGWSSERDRRDAWRDLEGIVKDTAEKLDDGVEGVSGGGALNDMSPGLAKYIARIWGWSKERERQEPPGPEPGPEPEPEGRDEGEAEGSPADNRLVRDRVQLAGILDGDIEPPPFQEAEILVRGALHLFFGAPECGKSWLALWLTVRAIMRGERVLYLDSENGKRLVRYFWRLHISLEFFRRLSLIAWRRRNGLIVIACLSIYLLRVILVRHPVTCSL